MKELKEGTKHLTDKAEAQAIRRSIEELKEEMSLTGQMHNVSNTNEKASLKKHNSLYQDLRQHVAAVQQFLSGKK